MQRRWEGHARRPVDKRVGGRPAVDEFLVAGQVDARRRVLPLQDVHVRHHDASGRDSQPLTQPEVIPGLFVLVNKRPDIGGRRVGIAFVFGWIDLDKRVAHPGR